MSTPDPAPPNPSTDPTPTPQEPAADPAKPTDPPAPEATDWQAQAEKWQKLSRQNEARAKENAAAAKELAEIKESQKSEADKLADRLTAAEERAAKAARMAVASSVKALATGRFADPADAVDTLGADFLTEAGEVDDAAIEQALAALLERKPHWAATEPGPRTPRPDPSQGPRPGGTASVDAQISEAQAKGDWKTVLRLQNSKLAPASASRPK